MKVSDECLIKSKICDSYTDGLPANSKKQTSHWRGNPASQFCENKGGSSVILKDEKSNEYDYCKFEEDFFIDSWDLYERSKK